MNVEETASVKKTEKEEDESTPRGQKRLPGMVPKRIKALQDQAEKVKDLQDERMATEEEERKERATLLELMKEHKVKRYPIDDDYEAVIESADEKAFVRKIKKAKSRKPAKD